MVTFIHGRKIQIVDNDTSNQKNVKNKMRSRMGTFKIRLRYQEPF
jgi:hypothetical protein